MQLISNYLTLNLTSNLNAFFLWVSRIWYSQLNGRILLVFASYILLAVKKKKAYFTMPYIEVIAYCTCLSRGNLDVYASVDYIPDNFMVFKFIALYFIQNVCLYIWATFALFKNMENMIQNCTWNVKSHTCHNRIYE